MRTLTGLTKESGVILVTVVVLIIILSIVAIGIMSLNVSQIKTSASVVDSVVAEQLATGVFYQDYQRRIDGTGSTPTNEVIGNKTFTISRGADVNGTGPNSTNQVQINITY